MTPINTEILFFFEKGGYIERKIILINNIIIKLCPVDPLAVPILSRGRDVVALLGVPGAHGPWTMGHGGQRQARGAPTNLRLQRASGHFQHYLWRPRHAQLQWPCERLWGKYQHIKLYFSPSKDDNENASKSFLGTVHPIV